MGWDGSYIQATEKGQLKPVYMLILARQDAQTDSDATDAATRITVKTGTWTFSLDRREDVFIYDGTGWEFITVDDFNENVVGKDQLDNCTRGVYGSEARAFTEHARVLRLQHVLTTENISDFTYDQRKDGWMDFPSGSTCRFVFQEGRTSYEGVTVDVHDRGTLITKRMQGWSPIGKRAVILGGYQGMAFRHFSMLYAGAIRSLNVSNGVYSFMIEADWDTLNKQLFGQMEDVDTALASGITDVATTLTTTTSDNTYNTSSTSVTLDDGFAAIYFKIGTTTYEYVRVTSGASAPTFTVARGQLGTAAVAHSQNAEVKMFYSIQDNPVNILLYLLMSRDRTLGVQHDDYDLLIGDTGDDPVGIGYQRSDIDIAGFEAIRDQWYPDQVWAVYFKKRTKMREYFEKNLLKAMNAHLYINRAGKLSLGVIAAPFPGSDSKILTEDHVINEPDMEFTNESIVNEVTVNWEYDVWDDEYDNKTVYIDATSQTSYDRIGTMDIDASGVSSLFSGSGLASRYARKKTRHAKDPAPPMTLDVLFNQGASIEPSDTLRLDLPNLPDISKGTNDFDNYVAVIGKRINWQEGSVTLEVIKTNFGNGRLCLVAPSGQVDYTSATTTDKQTYGFVGETGDNQLSNGDEGYVIG